MKKIIIISSLLLFTALPIWIAWDKEQKGIEMMTGGFGTQYADAPHPFNRPDYPVDCQGILGNDREDVILTIHQGETVLRIPRDAIMEVKKRSDSETCIPISIKLIYVWHDNKLLRAARDNSEANDAGADPGFIRATVTLKGLQVQSNDSSKIEREPNRLAEAKRYTPAYRHEFLPIWYYPNLYYDMPNKRDYTSIEGGIGVMGTIDPDTNFPITISCSFQLGTYDPNGNQEYTAENLLKADIIPTSVLGSADCETGYRIEDVNIYAAVNIDPKVVPYMDKIFPAIETNIKSYITENPNIILN